ncbi:MAG TPA: glutathione binding-like protein [Polyangiaceae bacterium]
MLKIYGNPMSTCTRKVLMTLNENGTPFEFSLVDLGKGEQKQEPNLARQPFGHVPALDDDGFEMFESRAMCRYLNEKANGHLVPKDLKARAKMEQWISSETSEFSSNVMKLIYEYVFKRTQAPEVLEAAKKGVAKACEVMDKQLAKTPYLVGDEFTLADICFMPYIEYTMGTQAKDEIFAKYPHFMAWWEKVSARPTWQKTAGKA